MWMRGGGWGLRVGSFAGAASGLGSWLGEGSYIGMSLNLI